MPGAARGRRSSGSHSVSTRGQSAVAPQPGERADRTRREVGRAARRAPRRARRAGGRTTCSCAAIITSWKIGAAPVTPDELRSGVRSKLPTQTPTVTSRVKPIVQLSWYACDVPVFTATGNGKSRLPPRAEDVRARVRVGQDVGDPEGGALARRAASRRRAGGPRRARRHPTTARTSARRADTRRRARAPRRRPPARPGAPRRRPS